MPQHTISDEQFARIEHLLPGKATDRGVTARDNRLFIDAVLWIDRNGAPWRALPAHFGHWNSVFRRFRRWAAQGVWDCIFAALQASDSIPDLEWVMLDSTSIRAHQQAAGQKKQRRTGSARSLTGRVHHESPRAL